MGLLNLVFAPFVFGVLVMFFFFRYAEQVHKSPSLLTMRDYTRLAEWKFREFNELPHYFSKRLNWSHFSAVQYMEGFPKEKTAIVARFVTFVSGAFASILAVVAWLDEDLLLNFEVTPGRSGLFYIGLFGAILAVSRALTPDEYLIYDPRGMMEEVAMDTHWLPDEWKDKLHADEVRREFSSYFQLRIVVFLQEIIGILVTPFLLMFRLPVSADNIVTFFLSNTSHADQVGWVCKYALFDLTQLGEGRDARVGVNKMSQSIVDFKHHHPEWTPTDPKSSMFSQTVRPTRPWNVRNPRMQRPKLTRPYQPAGRVVPLREYEDMPLLFDVEAGPREPGPRESGPRIVTDHASTSTKPYGKIFNVLNQVVEPRAVL
jgi:autophagy-related protein 9